MCCYLCAVNRCMLLELSLGNLVEVCFVYFHTVLMQQQYPFLKESNKIDTVLIKALLGSVVPVNHVSANFGWSQTNRRSH